MRYDDGGRDGSWCSERAHKLQVKSNSQPPPPAVLRCCHLQLHRSERYRRSRSEGSSSIDMSRHLQGAGHVGCGIRREQAVGANAECAETSE